jgi:hypothetical protein
MIYDAYKLLLNFGADKVNLGKFSEHMEALVINALIF